jgi:LmbE family N-acetylglucosaminyl deacetylase
MYEGPWSLFSKGSYNLIVSPSPDHFAKKMAAIAAHKSQTARTAYDRAADSLALLRGALVPEQDLSGWGENPPRLGDRLELFYRRPILTDDDIQQLLHWLDQQTPPRR